MVIKGFKCWLAAGLSFSFVKLSPSRLFKTLLMLIILALSMNNMPVYAYGSLNPIANNLLEKSAVDKETEAQNAELAASKTAKIQIRLSKKELLLGESFTFVLRGQYIGDAISSVDLSAFTQDFVIDDITQGDGFMRIKLYPLRVGKFVIKGQRAGNVDIPDFKVKVNKNPNLTITWQAPNQSAVGQELVSWLAHVEVDNAAFKVRYLLPEYAKNSELKTYIDEHSIQKQAIIQQNGEHSGESDITEHNLVAVFELPSPLKKQAISLHSPVVEVKNTTHKRWKFFDQPLDLTITPLPSFLPLSATVGKVNWQIENMNSVYESGKLYHWQWSLSAQNVTTDYLQGMVYELLRSLQIPQVQFLSEELDVQQTFNENGLFSEVTVKIPFRIKHAGIVSFADLNMAYFSTESQLVEQHLWQGQRLLALPSWLIWLGYWLMLVAILAALFIGLWFIKGWWLRRQFKNRLVSLLKTHSSTNHLTTAIWQQMQKFYALHPAWQFNLNALRKIIAGSQKLGLSFNKAFIQNLITAEELPTPQSLAQWSYWYKCRYSGSEELDQLITVMNQVSYQAKSAEQDTGNVTNDAKSLTSNRSEKSPVVFTEELLQAELQQALLAWRNTL